MTIGLLSRVRTAQLLPRISTTLKTRLLASSSTSDALVVGFYEHDLKAALEAKMPVSAVDSILSQLNHARFTGKKNEVRLLYGVEGVQTPIVAAVGLGKKSEDVIQNAEQRRSAAAAALASLKSISPKQPISIAFESLGDAHATAEGAVLGTYHFTHYKQKKAAEISVALEDDHSARTEWETGAIYAQAQNIARTVAETPANLMTPTIFCERAQELFKESPSVTVTAHDEAWARDQEMGAFLSVARGSTEPLRFLEVVYRGGNDGDKPIALVGKGVTFDTGGISLKPSTDMALMKGDMGGAAAVLGAMWGIAQLRPQVNVVAVMPLTENMPSGKATKPGDLIRARNGKTIEVDNTDAEGRLILADAIHYVGTTHNPHTLVELSTLTGAMDIALGSQYAGTFSNSDILWSELDKAGQRTGDRFWRMPLDDGYKKQIQSNVADLKNVGGRSAGSCTAAIFLKEFVPGLGVEGKYDIRFAHIDIAGVMHKKGGGGYISSGMTGRPTRSIIEFVRNAATA